MSTPCPCCGFATLSQPHQDEICPLCGWQDDGQDNADADAVWGGPNGGWSLSQARANFLVAGYFDPARRTQARLRDSVGLIRERYFEFARPSGVVRERPLAELALPLLRFEHWYAEAKSSPNLDYDAIALGTTDQHAQPHVRVLYFRRFVDGRFYFFSNHRSAKGRELRENDRAAVTFLWHPIHRQIRMEGSIIQAHDEISDDYFKQRPNESKLSAVTSKQSEELPSYLQFLNELESNRQEKKPFTRPAHWGAFGLIPNKIEFWHGRDFRRHLREEYTLDAKTQEWKMRLLYP